MYFYNNNSNTANSSTDKWYESFWGLAIVALLINLFSNWLYDKSQQKYRLQDELREFRREQQHLKQHHSENS